MKNKILLVSLLSLLAFNINAEEPVAGKKNFVELEIGQGFGKYEYSIADEDGVAKLNGSDGRPNLDTNTKPSIGIVYLKALSNDKIRLRTGLHYDTSKIDYKEHEERDYNINSNTKGKDIFDLEITTKNIIGLSLGGEYDVYKTEKYSLFASLVVNANYVESTYFERETDYNQSTGNILYDKLDEFDENGVVIPVEIGFGGLYNINNNFSFVGKAVYVTPASITVKYDDSDWKTEMGNYAKVSLALRYGF